MVKPAQTPKLLWVDAFTDSPYSGNPAAVCLLSHPKGEAWMQGVARELNVSETAFLHPAGDGFNLRWFSPTVEVDLCGHATLASAHVLWEEEILAKTHRARFHTRSGTLTARWMEGWIELNFPAMPEKQVSPPNSLRRGLGIQPRYVGRNQMDYLVEVASEETLRRIRPESQSLSAIRARGIIVTSLSSSNRFDFVSRFFSPQSGIPEDPVTGSAHCCLGPFWRKRLNKSELIAFQASPRGGIVRVRCWGNRVFLSGKAVTVLRGQLE